MGTPRRETLAAALFVLGLILVIVSFSWIESPGLASTPGAESSGPAGASLPAADTTDLKPDVAPAESTPAAPDVSADAPVNATSGKSKPPEDDQAAGAQTDSFITATNWLVIDTETNDKLGGAAANDEVAIASTVKIVTALVTLRYVDLSEEVLIEESDLVDPTIYSNMMLMTGDTLTVDQLLQGLLIPSGSDAANALARYVGTKIGEDPDPETATAIFVDAMNTYVQELGLTHTRFANPSGDDDPESYSSARDMAILGAELMKNDALAAIVGQTDYTFTSPGQGNTYTGVTTNQILGQDGIIGIKTGSTDEAGGCVILARETASGDVQIIAILGSALEYQENIITLDARWSDARAIIALLDNS